MGSDKVPMGLLKPIPLEVEYAKPTGIRPEDIRKLREWLKTQPHLPEEHITDLDVILAYHCCGRSVSVTQQLLDLHFTLKTLFTNFFKDRRFDASVEKMCNTVLVMPLTTATKEGYGCAYTHLLNYDPKNFILSDMLKVILMVLDLKQSEEGTWPGFIVALDMEGITLGHVAKLDIQSVQQFLYFVQEAMLLNLKSVHLLNVPPFIDKIMMLIKPFMNKSLMDIFYTHLPGAKTLEKFYPMDALPKESGGSFKSFEECRVQISTMLRDNEEFFIQEGKKRVVESKRPGKPKTITDIFGGIEGSFKKLDID